MTVKFPRFSENGAAGILSERPPLVLLLVFFALSFLSCGENDAPPSDAGGDVSVEPDAGTDATTASDAADANTGGAFEIGTNPAYESTAESFVLMTDGAEVPLTFGVQGSWMVVLAFRTHDMLEGNLNVEAEIAIDGVPSGDVALGGQETFPGGDGWDYYYNLFLAIDQDDPPPRGTPARIEVRVTDEGGTTAEQSHDVVIGPADGP